MARAAARLPAGSRITDFISLGVIAKTFPIDKVHEVLAATGKAASASVICPLMWRSTTSSRLRCS